MSHKPSSGLALVCLFTCASAHADVFTNVPEAADYQLVYTLPVPTNQGSFNADPIPFSVDNSAAFPPGSFSRVAYYLELSGSTDPTRPNGYVYVSFDRPAALPNGKSLGVPANGPNGSRIVTNTSVANMNVVSNIPGVTTGSGLAEGRLEFAPSNYATGANGVYDYDDDGFSAANGHGSMQIHNAALGQSLIAYNDWGGSSPGFPSEIGAGPNPGAGAPDWTFSDSGAAYTVKNLQVLVKPSTNLVPIVNASFETDAIAGGNAPIFEVRTAAPAGWTYSGAAGTQGLIAPDAGEPNFFFNGPTSGYSGAKAHFCVKSSAINPPSLRQNLSATLQANTTYTLSVQIGNRTNGDVWGGQRIALKTTSGTTVGEWVNGHTNATPDGTFAPSVRKFTTGANPPGLGQALQIVIEQPAESVNSYLDIDDVILTADPAPARPVGTPIDVMIVAGQSNAQGWQGNVNALSAGFRSYADSPSPNAFISYKQNVNGQALYISGSLGQLSPLGAGFAGNFDGFGPELATGTDLADRLGKKVAIIKFASGGASLNAHFKKAANNLYPLLINKINTAMAELTAQGFAPSIKGFFWLQGEADALDIRTAGAYGKNITTFVSNIRTDLGVSNLRFILTEINGNMPWLRDNALYASGTVKVNQGMQNLATSDAAVDFVTTSDITTGFADGIHYSGNQLIDIGQRWADAYAPAP